MNYYFTFGTSDAFPYQNGWVVVDARTLKQAVDKFNRTYPPRIEDLCRCASIYSEDEFSKTEFLEKGNLGGFAHAFLNAEAPERVYISGPITGVDGYLEHFQEVEERLQKIGYKTINPAAAFSGLEQAGLDWEEYMVLSFRLMDLCSHIYMLPNWENSKGARQEAIYAETHNIKQLFV